MKHFGQCWPTFFSPLGVFRSLLSYRSTKLYIYLFNFLVYPDIRVIKWFKLCFCPLNMTQHLGCDNVWNESWAPMPLSSDVPSDIFRWKYSEKLTLRKFCISWLFLSHSIYYIKVFFLLKKTLPNIVIICLFGSIVRGIATPSQFIKPHQ